MTSTRHGVMHAALTVWTGGAKSFGGARAAVSRGRVSPGKIHRRCWSRFSRSTGRAKTRVAPAVITPG